ncbi:gliding motility-associated C-terminal domain-containing protein [Flavobacterium sp. JP2137]|uniref:gliding motility-associated C-terminal domain-containing protein n=1 Tax=Flavobacterium sp. JP2137 TaxID=3414510 RepID=UPI003D3000AE
MYKYIVLLIGGGALAQHTPIMTNEGMLSISPKTEVATLFDFQNHKNATVSNDGTIYFYSDFQNEGLFTFDSDKKSSYAVFQTYNGQAKNQRLSGMAPTYFYDILFNDQSGTSGFDLQNDISIAGTANFNAGVVEVDADAGAVVFLQGAKHVNTSDKSHVRGKVERVGNNEFAFPVGDGGHYRPAIISKVPHLKDVFFSEYHLENSNAKYPHLTIDSDQIELINDKEFWTIDRGNTKNDVVLTLTWDEKTTPSYILDGYGQVLHIVRWDKDKNMWIDEGGIVDKSLKTVTIPTTINGYGVFTFAKVKEKQVEHIIIYNAVSPNGDGINDYFIIENIEQFPNNTVQIYNRWGVKVFGTTNYNTSGNVFNGVSDGRGTLQKSDNLPTGTYYYIITYEYTDSSGTHTVKKAGYLHLENN